MNTYSPPSGGGGLIIGFPLSQSPANHTHLRQPDRGLGGNLDRSQTGPMMIFGTGSSKLPY